MNIIDKLSNFDKAKYHGVIIYNKDGSGTYIYNTLGEEMYTFDKDGYILTYTFLDGFTYNYNDMSHNTNNNTALMDIGELSFSMKKYDNIIDAIISMINTYEHLELTYINGWVRDKIKEI